MCKVTLLALICVYIVPLMTYSSSNIGVILEYRSESLSHEIIDKSHHSIDRIRVPIRFPRPYLVSFPK